MKTETEKKGATKLTEAERKALSAIASGQWNGPATMSTRVWSRLLWRLHRARLWRQDWHDEVVVGRYLTEAGRAALRGES